MEPVDEGSGADLVLDAGRTEAFPQGQCGTGADDERSAAGGAGSIDRRSRSAGTARGIERRSGRFVAGARSRLAGAVRRCRPRIRAWRGAGRTRTTARRFASRQPHRAVPRFSFASPLRGMTRPIRPARSRSSEKRGEHTASPSPWSSSSPSSSAYCWRSAVSGSGEAI